MIYAVERSMDVLKVKKERETVPDFGGKRSEKYHYFDNEQDAKDFIVRRARINLENAEAEVRRVRKQLAKVVKRFAEPCRHGVDDPEQCGLCDDERASAALPGDSK